jgi:hypothetical protein
MSDDGNTLFAGSSPAMRTSLRSKRSGERRLPRRSATREVGLESSNEKGASSFGSAGQTETLLEPGE